jgi:hypothetical protein
LFGGKTFVLILMETKTLSKQTYFLLPNLYKFHNLYILMDL